MTRESSTNTNQRTQSSHSGTESLIFNVAGLLAEAPGTARHITISAPPLDFGDELTQISDIVGDLKLTRTNRGLLVRGKLRTAIAQTCARCLRDIEYPVVLDIDEEALPAIDIATGAPVPAEADAELRLTDHHELDLEREVRDGILVSEPIAPLCREDCPGLCAVCGEELSSGPHDHPEDDIDPRLEALRAFTERPES
jgi:uncharacterized protein